MLGKRKQKDEEEKKELAGKTGTNPKKKIDKKKIEEIPTEVKTMQKMLQNWKRKKEEDNRNNDDARKAEAKVDQNGQHFYSFYPSHRS